MPDENTPSVVEDSVPGPVSAVGAPAGSGSAAVPAGDASAAPKRKRGCRGCALGCLTAVLSLGLIVVLVLGYVFNWPRQWGWTEAPAEKLFAASPNPWAADAILAELKAAGIDTTGTTVYVVSSLEGSGTVAYVLFEDARGAKWQQREWQKSWVGSAVEGLLVEVARTKAAARYGVVRIAVDHRDENDVQAALMTAPRDAAIDFGAGKLTRAQFHDACYATADIPGFLEGMSE